MPRYYEDVFAGTGDRAAIPNDTQPSGSVSYEQGFGPDYQKDLATDPAAKPFPRDQYNQFCYDLTDNFQDYQQWGAPLFIPDMDAAPLTYAYGKYALTSYDDGVNGRRIYQSRENSNTALPSDPTKWTPLDGLQENLYYYTTDFNGGVTDGRPVAFNESSEEFELAVANGTFLSNVVGLADVTNGRILLTGTQSGLSGLTVGAAYYLTTDELDTGAIVVGEPANKNNNVLIGYAVSATTLIVLPQIKNTSSAIISQCYSTSVIVIPANSTGTLIPFINLTVGYDPFGIFSLSDAGFIVPFDGWYDTGTLLRISNNPVSTTDVGLSAAINGSTFIELSQILAKQGLTIEGEARLKLSAGDVVQIYGSVGTGGAQVDFYANTNYFYINYLGT
jgi:hypothetical protein